MQEYAANGALLHSTTRVSGNAITFDQHGYVYVAGGNASSPPFVTKLTPDLQTATWTAALSSGSSGTPHAIAVDPNSGVVYIAGETTAATLNTTAGVVQPTGGGESDGFIASVSPDGSAFGFVTYLGGSGNDQIYAMTLDGAGNIVVAGDTRSADFPVANAVQPKVGGNAAPLFATTDYGKTWTAEGVGLPPADNSEAFSVDPANPSVIVAATDVGLYRSTDGGATWAQVGPAGSYVGEVPMLSRSYANPEVLYALLNQLTVVRSSDGGATWTTGAAIEDTGYTIVASPQDANTVIVFTLFGMIITSTDGGATLNRPTGGGSASGPAVPSPDGSIYMPAGYYAYGRAGFLKSTDNGKTWQPLADSPYGGYSNAPPLSVCSAIPSVLYFSGGFLYRSSDAGLTWTTTLGNVWFAIVAPSNCQILYAQGPEVSVDGGATWSPASAGVTAIVNPVAVDPTNPAHAWATSSINPDGFAAKISSDGKTLLWSTYYGGSGWEDVHGVVVDNAGNTWIAGTTSSADLPGIAGAQPEQSSSSLFLAQITDSTAACSFRLDPPSADPPGAGGIVNFAVTAPSTCSWTATPSDQWIFLTPASGGTASGSVAAVIAANNTGAARTGTIVIQDQTFTITQPPASCQYSLSPSFVYLPPAGGQTTVNVTAGAGCPWRVVPSKLTVVSGVSGAGNGSVTLAAPPNSGSGYITFTPTIGNVPFPVTVAENCTYELSVLSVSGASQQFLIDVFGNSAFCRWFMTSDAAWLSALGSGGDGANTVYATVTANLTGAPRTANIFIGSQTFQLTQTPDTLPRYTLTVLAQPPAGGTVSGGGVYDSGQYAYLNAAANLGWTFTGWTGASLTSFNTSLAVTADNTITANFTQNTYALGLTALPAGGGTITANPLPTNGGYPSGTKVCLTITPAQGWTLSSLSGTQLDASNCLTMYDYASVTANFIFPINTSALSFIPVTPCRAVDTRNAVGPLGGPSIGGGMWRYFAIAGNACSIPANAAALALNAAIVPTSHGYMTLWPTGQPQPATSSVNSPDGGVHSNGSIVPVGGNGSISVYALDTMDVVLDVSGYFVPASDNNPNALAFYPVTPCRVADTRSANGDLGGPFLSGGSTRTFPIQEAATMCDISAAAQAYSLNLAVVPRTGVFHYLTAWPTGQPQPAVSSLNDPQAVNHSSGAIVPAGTNGSIDVYATNDTDVIIDINGYFAPPSPGGLSLYTLQPCRALDTRNPAGSAPFTGTIPVNIEASDCGAPSTAQAYVFNATVVPQAGSHGFLTLWQESAAQPGTANLNDPNGITTGNLAIVPTNNGSINAFFYGTGYLVLDLFGYFAP